MKNKIKIIYLIGAGRSGTTLLDIIADSHSKIVGIGELSNWVFEKEKQSKMPCSCGKSLSDCSFWQKVFDNIPNNLRFYNSKLKVNQKKIDFLFNQKKYFFAANSKIKFDLEKYLELNERIYQNILSVSGKKVILDSSKEMDRAEVILQNKNLEIVFIHLVRDGRGTTFSYKRKHGGIISPMLLWIFNNIKAEIFKKRYPNKTIFLRYEDFCKDPEWAIKKILNKVNLNFEPEMLKFREKIHHQVDGNPLRLKKGNQEIKEDLAWKEELPFGDKVIFNTLFGWLNFYYFIKRKK